MSFRALLLRAGPAAGAARRSSSVIRSAGIRSSSTRSMAPDAEAPGRPSGRGPPPPAEALTPEARRIREQPGDEPHDVVFESRYGLRSIMLNRPKKLNSLDGSMIRKIVPRLVEWEKSDMANVVVIKGAGDKAFCAGGDVAVLAQQNKQGTDGWKGSAEYFALEYKLDHYIATYPKPFIAFMDGITMGGGVGLSVHAPFRIATERTVFAMPETTIGFFPDVGASFFLPRMNGAVGTYLALTSNRLKGANVFYAGVATHYLHSTSLPSLEARLAELIFHDGHNLPKRLQIINQTLEEFCTGLPPSPPMELAGELRRAIDRCFSKNTVAQIMAALEAETGETKEWAQQQLETLHKRSPTAVHVTLRQMREGGKWNIAEAFSKEHQMASKFMRHPDFTEGVTALLLRKETPRWKPESLEAIPAGNDVARPFFRFDPKSRLDLLTIRNSYRAYPFRKLGVPSEVEIRDLLSSKPLTPEELADEVIASRGGRQGIAEIVQEIIARKVTVNAEGKATWTNDEGDAKSDEGEAASDEGDATSSEGEAAGDEGAAPSKL
ncbi:hypothetical protein CDD83_2947 [Cordyceps sp. RAO-2017]|nr:hypothetical protein CDD83_2947 [Cordyceps sp. RAO-2017]